MPTAASPLVSRRSISRRIATSVRSRAAASSSGSELTGAAYHRASRVSRSRGALSLAANIGAERCWRSLQGACLVGHHFDTRSLTIPAGAPPSERECLPALPRPVERRPCRPGRSDNRALRTGTDPRPRRPASSRHLPLARRAPPHGRRSLRRSRRLLHPDRQLPPRRRRPPFAAEKATAGGRASDAAHHANAVRVFAEQTGATLYQRRAAQFAKAASA